MKDKVLIFIPYQDSDSFYSDGIFTREFAMLYMLYQKGYTKIINVKKPRTVLDTKRYKVNSAYYPEGTIENIVKNILDKSKTIQYKPFLSCWQLLLKRSWWFKGYMHCVKDILKEIERSQNCLVYSNNPYAAELLKVLKDKKCKIYFDVMDNFAIHPSLNANEQSLALEGYKSIFQFADIVSANSQQTCDYMSNYCPSKIILVKNGVFLENSAKDLHACEQINQLTKIKAAYSKTIGYIGKLGKRLDAQLVKTISNACPDALFVFVGPYLKGQMNSDLIKLFEMSRNVIHLEGIPSAFVYAMLDQFDVLMIPHSVGKNENGGDPLKLYQYLTRNKPIITTPILGVDEFKDYIEITSDFNRWIEFIKKSHPINNQIEIAFDWPSRLKPVFEKLY